MLGRIGCLFLLLTASACATQRPLAVQPGLLAVQPALCTQVGLASWYRPQGRRTADGDRYGPDALIAANRSLPFGTRVRVTDLDSGRSVVVRIDDRGPFVRGRIIDLSAAAAGRLGMRQDGVATVRLAIPGRQPGDACPFDASAGA